MYRPPGSRQKEVAAALLCALLSQSRCRQLRQPRVIMDARPERPKLPESAVIRRGAAVISGRWRCRMMPNREKRLKIRPPARRQVRKTPTDSQAAMGHGS